VGCIGLAIVPTGPPGEAVAVTGEAVGVAAPGLAVGVAVGAAVGGGEGLPGLLAGCWVGAFVGSGEPADGAGEPDDGLGAAFEGAAAGLKMAGVPPGKASLRWWTTTTVARASRARPANAALHRRRLDRSQWPGPELPCKRRVDLRT